MRELTLSDLLNGFKIAKEEEFKFMAVKISMQGFDKPEIIINSKENFETKAAYYQKAYNEDLTLKTFNGIKIENFAYANSFDDIQTVLI